MLVQSRESAGLEEVSMVSAAMEDCDFPAPDNELIAFGSTTALKA
jgi:hypothetical protein